MAAEKYVELLAQVGAAQSAVYITKSSPSSVFEANSAGIPVISLQSGLPMELWIADFVEQHGLGWNAPTVAACTLKLQELLRQPAKIAAMSVSAREFSARCIDNAKTSALIGESVRAEYRLQLQAKMQVQPHPKIADAARR